jgi:sigma-B regulation protein RsbU (phosphoserine phosphatase)
VSAGPERPAPEPGRLLVVDDVEANRDLLARRLRQMGHIVETASDGREALTRLRGENFDLVLLDVMMPEMDGYQVLEALRGDEALRQLPVVMVSAVHEMESVVRCLESGAADYLPKPINGVLLRARVDSSLEKKRLRDRERLWAKSLERELEIGRNIQSSFLPRTLPECPGWDVAALLRPARQVGGDFYDIFGLAGGTLGLVVGDVCGKGVGAALFMAVFRSLIRVAAGREAEEGASPAEIARNTIGPINDFVARTHGDANMFATTFFGVLDPVTGLLSYVNGGHEPPVLLRLSGHAQRLPPTGPAVGLMPGMEFASQDERIRSGDLLLAFTVGVTEAKAPSGELFSDKRLLSLLDGGPAAATVSSVADAVRAHAAGADPTDDVALLALRRTG